MTHLSQLNEMMSVSGQNSVKRAIEQPVFMPGVNLLVSLTNSSDL